MSASHELYSLDLATSKWSVLQAFPHNEVSLKNILLILKWEGSKEVSSFLNSQVSPKQPTNQKHVFVGRFLLLPFLPTFTPILFQ